MPATHEGRELDEGKQPEATKDSSSSEDDRLVEEEDGPWYYGKAREEFRKRRGGQIGHREEEDPVQVIPSIPMHVPPDQIFPVGKGS